MRIYPLILLLLLASLGAKAQYGYLDYGNLDLAHLAARVDYLEEAVRNIENYLAQSIPTGSSSKVITCIVKNILGHTYIGKGNTQIEAEHNASRECRKDSASCSLDRCERTQ